MERDEKMVDFYERYQVCMDVYQHSKRVWGELLSLGEGIHQEPISHQVRGVVYGTMKRVKENVATLIDRLYDLDYQFAYPDEMWVKPNPITSSFLDSIEEQYGLLPRSIRGWYEVVGSVNFMGQHPELNFFDQFSYEGWDSFHCYPDPLVIAPVQRELPSYFLNEVYEESGLEINTPPYALLLAPDAVHKANHSGGGPTQIMLPNPVMDAPLISDEWDGILFINYLRTCFKWGGFPGWRFNPDYPKDVLSFLTKDLLPL